MFATNSPINDRVALHSKMAPYRTYAMAFTLPRGTLPDALYWDMADPYHYIRLNPGPGTTDYLIVRRQGPQDAAKPMTATCASRRSRPGSGELRA